MAQYRSRALWDATREPNAPLSSYIKAILYELQPVRFSTICPDSSSSFSIKDIIRQVTGTIASIARVLFRTTKKCCRYLFEREWTWREVLAPSIVIMYCYVLKYIHRALDAGPLFLIITALIVIFTVGLSDDATRGNISAYSVFNRGFRQLLGSIDVEHLVNQYVGGGMAVAAAGGNDDAWHPGAEEPNGGRRQQQQQQQQQLQQPRDGTSRKSGKKARRGDLERRREIQRQRRAAREMGLGEDGMALNDMMENDMMENDLMENDILDDEGEDGIELLDAGFDG